jgi:Rrf2 family protein
MPDLDCDNGPVRISAKADYAVRAALELAATPDGEPVKGEQLAASQKIPLQFLEHLLLELKHARLIRSKRGASGGYWLAKPPDDITVADVIRAVEGPLANIQDSAPEDTEYPGAAKRLSDVWIAVRASLRAVLEQVTLADIRDGNLPEPIASMASDPDAWLKR